jgi:hypothetical protein
MRRWLAAIVPCLLCAILLTGGARAEITAGESITVSGDHFHLGGVNFASPLVGVDDTTALVFAVYAHCEGFDEYWGYNQNFPGPDMTEGALDCDNLLELWHQYFWLCNCYGIGLLRTGACDDWATQILYEAMQNHPVQFAEVVDVMLHEAAEHDVYVELTIAGTQDWPIYQWGKGTNPLDQSTTAFAEYIRYANQVINCTENSTHHQAIFAFDAWNEPDHDQINAGYWLDDELLFRGWAENISSRLCPITTHIVDMGVAGQGTFFNWGYGHFLNATGLTGFDICHRHYYASAEDTYLATDPLNWSATVGKPLFWGELANSATYPLIRWTTFEAKLTANGGEAWANMVLRGSGDYPFIGVVPGDEEPAGTETGPETYPQPDGGGGGGGGDDIPIVTELESVPLQYFAVAGGLLIAAAIFTTKHPKLLFILGAVLLGYALFEGGWL